MLRERAIGSGVILLALVLIAGGVHLHLAAPIAAPAKPKDAPVTTAARTSAPAPAKPEREDLSGHAHADDALSGQERTQAAVDRYRASMRTLAATMTPQVRRQLVDSKIRNLRSEYSQLFEPWDLDPATEEKVLAVIRERETHLLDLVLEHGHQDSSGWTKAVKAEGDWAKAQLVILLGESRHEEFAELDAEIGARSAAAGRQYVEAHRKDK